MFFSWKTPQKINHFTDIAQIIISAVFCFDTVPEGCSVFKRVQTEMTYVRGMPEVQEKKG